MLWVLDQTEAQTSACLIQVDRSIFCCQPNTEIGCICDVGSRAIDISCRRRHQKAGEETTGRISRGPAIIARIENRRFEYMSELAEKACVSCKGGVPPLERQALARLLKQLANHWEVINEHHLEKLFTFKNFRDALAFTNKVGGLAEEQGHHPDIHLAWGSVRITLWTHKIDGLTENDFIMAAKIDHLTHC